MELDDAVILDGDALMHQKKFRQLFFAISCMLVTSLAGDRWGTAERWGGCSPLAGQMGDSHCAQRGGVLSTALGRVPLICAPGTFGMDTGKGKERGECAHTQNHTHSAKEAAGSLIRLFLRINSSDLHFLLHTSPCPPAYHFVPSRIDLQPVPVRPHPCGRRAAVGARARGHSVFFFPSVANSWLTGESQRAWPRRSPHEENAGPRGRGRESLLLSFV